MILIIVVVLVVVAAAGAALGVILSKRKTGSAAANGGPNRSTSASAGSPKPTGTTGSTSGTSGSIVTFEDGTKFTYNNDFGGDWAMNPRDPFGPGGKAQSWTPRIGTEEWKWGRDIVRGVNIG